MAPVQTRIKLNKKKNKKKQNTSSHLQIMLVTNPRSVLYITDFKLCRDVEAVQEVSSKHYSVNRGVDGMDPT